MQHKKRALRTVLLLRNTLAVIAVVLAVAVAVVSWRLLSAGNSQAEQDDNLTTVTTEEESQGAQPAGDPAAPDSTAEQEDTDNSDLPQDADSQKRFPFLPEGSTLPDAGATQEDGSALPSEKDPMAPPAEGGQIL